MANDPWLPAPIASAACPAAQDASTGAEPGHFPRADVESSGDAPYVAPAKAMAPRLKATQEDPWTAAPWPPPPAAPTKPLARLGELDQPSSTSPAAPAAASPSAAPSPSRPMDPPPGGVQTPQFSRTGLGHRSASPAPSSPAPSSLPADAESGSPADVPWPEHVQEPTEPVDASALAEMLLRMSLQEATGTGTWDRLIHAVVGQMSGMSLQNQQMINRVILEVTDPIAAATDGQHFTSATSEVSDIEEATTAPFPTVPDPRLPVRATGADIGMIRAFGAQVFPAYLHTTIPEVMLQAGVPCAATDAEVSFAATRLVPPTPATPGR